MRLNTRGTLAARLRKLEERPVPHHARFVLHNGREVGLPLSVCLSFVCREEDLPDQWAQLLPRIVGLAEGEQGGLLMGIVVSMAAWRRSGLDYATWYRQERS